MPDTVAQIAVLTVFPAAMVLAGLSDLFTMRVSNRLTLALAAAFFVVAPAVGMDLETIGVHLAVGLVMLAICVALFAPGWIGGGDAKLIAVTGLWLGLEPLGHYLLVSAFVGCALTLAILKFRGVPLPEWAGNQPWIARLHRADRGAPYCVALSIAALSAYPTGELFRLAAL